MKLTVTGFDPSLRNWGIAKGLFDTETQVLEIVQVDVIQPVLPKGKQVRQNSLDLETATQLHMAALAACKDAHAVFVEIPIGSQSARAMASYGVCVGVLGALRGAGIPFYELTPTEVKMAGPGNKTASKEQMIRWAVNKHPEANWPMYKQLGQMHVVEGKAEHMADAVAAIQAGIKHPAFQQLLRLGKEFHADHALPAGN